MRRAVVLSCSLLFAASAHAQRAPEPSLPSFETVGRFAVDTSAARPRDGWSSLTRGQRDARRALWATGGGVLGLAVGAGGAILILSNDNRPNSDVDAIGFLALSAIGETLGVAIGAAAAGGPGEGACRGDVRLLRSFAGTLTGTAFGALVFQHQQTAGVVLMPVSQIAGAVLSLGGC